MKPVKLPAEAEEQVIKEFAALKEEANQTLQDLRAQIVQMKAEAAEEVDAARRVIDTMLADKFAGVEMVADMWADYELAVAKARSDVLKHKSRPAEGAAREIQAKGRELAAMRREVKFARHLLALYELHFPWLTDLRDEGDLGALFEGIEQETKATEGEEDPVGHWLTKEEFAALSSAERNQRALDRYLTSSKSPWHIGRDYEAYIGYLREQDGCTVSYYGMLKGLDDLGRDLIAVKDGRVEVIQCKRWAQHKTIHEKHVFQLFGTMTAYRIENPTEEVRGTFVTTTSLSDRAKEFAAHLNITIEEQVPLGDYPRIKCNIGTSTRERIYHLPFDQQYDTTVIDPSKGEFFAHTVAEAEASGFRRAWRWQGAQSS